MLHANISKLFIETGRNKILTLSLDTTHECLFIYSGAVVWSSSTNLDFLVIFPFILIPYIMCTLTCLYPGLIFLSSSHQVKRCQVSQILYGYLPIFAISLFQNPDPDFLSILYASFTVLGTCIPKLCDGLQYLVFILKTILFQRCKVSLTQHLKPGSSLI